MRVHNNRMKNEIYSCYFAIDAKYFCVIHNTTVHFFLK